MDSRLGLQRPFSISTDAHVLFSNRVKLYTSDIALVAAWLAQLVEHRTVVREVEGSSPRPDQHSGS